MGSEPVRDLQGTTRQIEHQALELVKMASKISEFKRTRIGHFNHIATRVTQVAHKVLLISAEQP